MCHYDSVVCPVDCSLVVLQVELGLLTCNASLHVGCPAFYVVDVIDGSNGS